MRYFQSPFFSSLKILSAMILCLGYLGGTTPHVQATIDVNITQGTFRPIPLVLLIDGGAPDLTRQITDVIATDLGGCGVFNPLMQSFVPQLAAEAFAGPAWQAWRQTGGEILLVATAQEEGDKVTIQFRVFDILNARELTALSLSADKTHLRRLSHQVADAVYARVTGHGGYFDTQIVYISHTGKGKKTKFNINIMDQDGFGNRILTKVDAHLVKAPHFSPDGKKIVYIANKKRQHPEAFVYDLASGEESRIPVEGRVFSAKFVPGQDRLLLSLVGGQASIGACSLNGSFQPLVNKKRGMDTSPSCSPDGTHCVFVSDRGGPPQLYTMPCAGGEPQRLSYGVGSCFAPAWSPKGNQIAFIRRDGGFYLSVMDVTTGQERILASFHLVDSPSWAPNGHALVFMAKERDADEKIMLVDMTSFKIRRIPTPSKASEPACSPLR